MPPSWPVDISSIKSGISLAVYIARPFQVPRMKVNGTIKQIMPGARFFVADDQALPHIRRVIILLNRIHFYFDFPVRTRDVCFLCWSGSPFQIFNGAGLGFDIWNFPSEKGSLLAKANQDGFGC